MLLESTVLRPHNLAQMALSFPFHERLGPKFHPKSRETTTPVVTQAGVVD
jgi:hypothetical protein